MERLFMFILSVIILILSGIVFCAQIVRGSMPHSIGFSLIVLGCISLVKMAYKEYKEGRE